MSRSEHSKAEEHVGMWQLAAEVRREQRQLTLTKIFTGFKEESPILGFEESPCGFCDQSGSTERGTSGITLRAKWNSPIGVPAAASKVELFDQRLPLLFQEQAASKVRIGIIRVTVVPGFCEQSDG